MKRYNRIFAYAVVMLLLLALVLVVASAAQPGAGDGADGPEDSSRTIWGPLVGSPSGETVKLEPLAIPEDMLGANASIVSDDFNWCSLDTTVWQWFDPLGDSSNAMTGTFSDDAWFEITVPAGTSHDIWHPGNLAARVMQTVDDTNFEVEAKFESGVEELYQMQGILVEEADNSVLRFEYFSDGLDTYLFAVILEPVTQVKAVMTPTIKFQAPVYPNGQAPLWMRIKRQGDTWTQYYSSNGQDWAESVNFNHPMTVRKVGVYGANATNPRLEPPKDPPAHTAKVDYFFNTSSPIVPEDSLRNTLTVSTTGQGLVGRDKQPSIGEGGNSYLCDELVTLTPNPDPTWGFENWTGPNAGDVVDNQDGTWGVTMDGPKEVTANFSHAAYSLTITYNGQGVVQQDPAPPYLVGQVVTLTTVPDSGWAFDKWTGPDQADPVDIGGGKWTITMDEDKELTANFVRALLDITVNIEPSDCVLCQVRRSPPPEYLFGEEVCLQPDAPNLWQFEGWSGPDAADLVPGNDPVACPLWPAVGTWHLTMDGNKELTATFGNYQVFLPLVVRSY